MIKNLIVIVSLCFLVAACDNPTGSPQQMDAFMKKKFTYVTDPNTGLCFARYESDGPYPNYMYTYVPCDKVSNKLFTNTK